MDVVDGIKEAAARPVIEEGEELRSERKNLIHSVNPKILTNKLDK